MPTAQVRFGRRLPKVAWRGAWKRAMPNALCAHRSLLFALAGVHLGRALALAETTALTQTPGTNVESEAHQTRSEAVQKAATVEP